MPDKNDFKIPTEKTVWKFSPAKTFSKNAGYKNDSEIKRFQKKTAMPKTPPQNDILSPYSPK